MTAAERVARLLASSGVQRVAPPRAGVPWPFAAPEPDEVAALYAQCDGLELGDGAVVLGRGELADVTSWLVLDRALDWPPDLVVVGERGDLVVALDLDVDGARAGGGVVEVPTDDLRAFTRVAGGLVGWAELHAGLADATAPPEVLARAMIDAGDCDGLVHALAAPWYPGQDALAATAWLALGRLHAVEGARGSALAAFEQHVELRASLVGRGAREAEEARAWRGAAHEAARVGDEALAQACRDRAGGDASSA